MDNFTHALTGIAMSQAGLNRFARSSYPTWLLFWGSNAPDIDVFWALSGGPQYLDVHRGFSHSLGGAPVVALPVVGLVWALHRWRKRDTPFPWLAAWLLAIAGALQHVLLDFLTPYGTRLFSPFNEIRYAYGILPVVDLWLGAGLLAATILPFLFRLISEEIGAGKASFRPAATFMLMLFIAWGGLRALAYMRAHALLDAHLFKGMTPRRFSAYPDMGSPFIWHAVIDLGSSLEVKEMNLLRDFDPTRTRSYFAPEPHPALDAARKTRTMRSFLAFAVYPYGYVETKEAGYEVVYRDLRYEVGTFLTRGAVARVELDSQFNVLQESFHFRDSKPVR
jgi:inner membrane protein